MQLATIENKHFYVRLRFILLLIETAITSTLCVRIVMKVLLIDSIFNSNSKVIKYLVIIGSLMIIELMLLLLKDVVKIWFERKYKYTVAEKVIDKLQGLNLLEVEKNKNQDLVLQSKNFITILFESIDAVGALISAVVFFMIFSYLASSTNFLILLIYFLLIIAIYIIIKWSNKKTGDFWKKYMSNMRRSHYYSDTLAKREYAYERSIYGHQAFLERGFSSAFDKGLLSNIANGKTRFRYQFISEIALILLGVITYIIFVVPLNTNIISIGVYTGIISSTGMVIQRVALFSERYKGIEEFNTLRNSLSDFFKIEDDTTHYESEEEISLKNISFSYIENDTVLTDVNFVFKKGKHYGIVGENGSGKSTLIKILMGLYEGKYEGTCKSIKAAVLFQDFNLFNLTVKEFILLGNESTTTNTTLFEALGKVNMLEKVNSLSNGINTKISLITSEGTSLSKGETQRLAIARLLLSSCNLIILDEPTSNLDPIAEKEMFEMCLEVFKDKTTIFVTHRLGAVKKLDCIVVLDQKMIVESGKHESLMMNNGKYSNLYNAQRSMYVYDKN